MFEDGFFGDLFDFDGEGHLDDFETAADFGLFMELMEEEENEDDFDDDGFDDYDDDWDL